MARIAATFLLLVSTFATDRAGADSCYADWSVAAPIVRKEGLTTVETLWKLAQSKIFGQIVKTTLCEEKGGFVYRLVVRDPTGRLVNRKVDARQPFKR